MVFKALVITLVYNVDFVNPCQVSRDAEPSVAAFVHETLVSSLPFYVSYARIFLQKRLVLSIPFPTHHSRISSHFWMDVSTITFVEGIPIQRQ